MCRHLLLIAFTTIGLSVAFVVAVENVDIVCSVFVTALAIAWLLAVDAVVVRYFAPASSKCEFLESPYSGDVDGNLRYLSLAGIDSFARGKMPTSTHGSMTVHPACKDLFVSDFDPKWEIFSRSKAIERGQALRSACGKTVFYIDRGWSRGMQAARNYCIAHRLPFEERTVDVDLVLSTGAPMLSRKFVEAVCAGPTGRAVYERMLQSCDPTIVVD